MVSESRVWADDISGSVTEIVTDRRDIAKAKLPPNAGSDVNGLIALQFFGVPQVIIIKPTTRCWRVSPDRIDPMQAARDLGNAESIKLDDIAVGDRLLVRGQPPAKKRNDVVHVVVADVVMDAGPGLLAHHWHPHEMFSLNPQKFGSFSGDGLSMKYTEPHSPDHNFTMSCEEFIGSAQIVKHQGGYYLDVQRAGEHFSLFEVGTYDAVLGSENEDRPPDGKAVALVQDLLKVPCSKGRDAEFRSSIQAAWRASQEAEPFASVRGDFDLASPAAAWKTRIQLPDADRCVLIKTTPPGPTAAPLLTYACVFRASTDTYERIVKLVQSALSISYQPDESAVNVNQVFFSDRSKPAWKLVVTKTSNASAVLLRIMPQQSATSIPDVFLPPDAGLSNTTAQPSVLTIREEVEKIMSGKYTPLPPIQTTGVSASGNGMAVFEVKNDTAYTLTVLFSGPTERRLELAPGASISVELLPGSYKLVGRVNAPNVLPSYGEHLFNLGSSGVKFYIQ
jgi:hypothetical protein